ncbi:hypothetical protein F5887DRAFT_923660 [Amanita rubescens]|nr:hypothetical protein F5887DRAFT_923660 [Amanita rubescens]
MTGYDRSCIGHANWAIGHDRNRDQLLSSKTVTDGPVITGGSVKYWFFAPPRAGLLSSIMLFLHELLFFLLFILLGPSMVSADHPPDALHLPDMKYCGTWFRKPGTAAKPEYHLDMIRSLGDGYINFENFGQPGARGPDVFRNKDRVLGRWRQPPMGYISLRDRLSELSIWKKGGKINCQMIYPEVQLPSKESSPLGNRLAEALPTEYEGTWYRVVRGLDGDDDSDVIVNTPNKPLQRGELHRYTAGVYLLNERITLNHLVGGWLLAPSPSGQSQPKDLLLIWIKDGKLEHELTSLASYIVQSQSQQKARSGT